MSEKWPHVKPCIKSGSHGWTLGIQMKHQLHAVKKNRATKNFNEESRCKQKSLVYWERREQMKKNNRPGIPQTAAFEQMYTYFMFIFVYINHFFI